MRKIIFPHFFLNAMTSYALTSWRHKCLQLVPCRTCPRQSRTVPPRVSEIRAQLASAGGRHLPVPTPRNTTSTSYVLTRLLFLFSRMDGGLSEGEGSPRHSECPLTHTLEDKDGHSQVSVSMWHVGRRTLRFRAPAMGLSFTVVMDTRGVLAGHLEHQQSQPSPAF